ncbi:MAG: hypothetical protein G3M78_07835 [Candidatus Nitrohelix vancouverensis]|uniref:SGNH/GDSL hydrolase family protein n=1 Tax=Candidatus Nitrohelix vancouverensis TaxID=2705534 RepID=A0A7T0C2G4_9BACT|nr:MAG: hypothetical protein G3M78_07835 [Candidatus Nitrohelix vancouverensis]
MKNFLIVVVATLCSLLVSELLIRQIDGYIPFSMRLQLSSSLVDKETLHSQKLINFAKSISNNEHINPEWILSVPEDFLKRLDNEPIMPELLARRDALASEGPIVSEWTYQVFNKNFLVKTFCGLTDFGVWRDIYFDRFSKIKSIYTFNPLTETHLPQFRNFPNFKTPHRKIHNKYGWRGVDIEVNKPPRTIRIAFLGASTTYGATKFSYPELVGHWLNLWAQSRQLDIKFEVMNTGRNGIDSQGIKEILYQEVLPFEPDMVVYFEGINQFNYLEWIQFAGTSKPAPYKIDFEIMAPEQKSKYSAIVNRVLELLNPTTLRELPKQKHTLTIPDDLDTKNPDILDPSLNQNNKLILDDLKEMNAEIKKINSSLIMASFIMLAEDGLKLDPVKHKDIHRYLNEVLKPYTYSELRQLMDFQNRLTRSFSKTNDLEFIDVASDFPMDPDLFLDAVHTNPDGTTFKAWTFFSKLIPIIQSKLDSGALPKPDQNDDIGVEDRFDVHTVEFDKIKCDYKYKNLSLPEFTRWRIQAKENQHKNKISADKLTLYGDSSQLGYQIMSPNVAVQKNTIYQVNIELKVLKGQVCLGVLDETSNWLLIPQCSLNRKLLFDSKNNRSIQLVASNNFYDQPAENTIFEMSIP